MSDNGQAPQEVDLERTDRLPVVDGTVFDADVVDDAVKLDFAPAEPSIKAIVTRPAVDLPSLAESVRSVEERIARQSAENDALRRSYDRALLDHQAASEALRGRLERALSEAKHHQNEGQAARDALAGRDATVAQTLHSLAERDAQLHALQREHARVVPSLQERSHATTQLEEALQAARARYDELAAAVLVERGAQEAQLAQLRRQAADLAGQLAERVSDIANLEAARRDAESRQAALEVKQRELESVNTRLVQQVAALDVERERLNAALEERIHAAQQAAQQAAADRESQLESLRDEVRARERRVAALTMQIEELRGPSSTNEAEVQRLHKELGARTATVEQVNEENRALRAALERTRGALEERDLLIRRLERSERNNANVLGRIQSSIERLGAVAGRTAGRVAEGAGSGGNDNGTDRGGGAEPADVLENGGYAGTATDVQSTSGLGAAAGFGQSRAPVAAEGVVVTHPGNGNGNGGGAPALAVSAELVRIDGRNHATHALGSQTRIGRAPGSELQIESSSVSRHHAYIGLTGSDIVIEDLNSTNGVLINGRKVARQHLHDGDTVTIGEATFRLHVRFLDRGLPAAGPEPQASRP